MKSIRGFIRSIDGLSILLSLLIFITFFMIPGCGGGGGGGSDGGEKTTNDGIVAGTAYFPFYPTYATMDHLSHACRIYAPRATRLPPSPLPDPDCDQYRENSDPWEWEPEYYEDVNQNISVFLHNNNGDIIKDFFTASNGYFELTGLPDGYYYLSAYCEEPSELDPAGMLDVFETETDIFEVGNSVAKDVSLVVQDLRLVFIETIVAKNVGNTISKTIPPGGPYMVLMSAIGLGRPQEATITVGGKIEAQVGIEDDALGTSWQSPETPPDNPGKPSGTVLEMSISPGPFIKPSQIIIWNNNYGCIVLYSASGATTCGS